MSSSSPERESIPIRPPGLLVKLLALWYVLAGLLVIVLPLRIPRDQLWIVLALLPLVFVTHLVMLIIVRGLLWFYYRFYWLLTGCGLLLGVLYLLWLLAIVILGQQINIPIIGRQ